MITKEYYINAFKDAARILDERAEDFCIDVMNERVVGFTIYIKFDRDSSSLEVSKEYGINPFRES